MANVANASTRPAAVSSPFARTLSPVDSIFALGASMLLIALVSGFFLK